MKRGVKRDFQTTTQVRMKMVLYQDKTTQMLNVYTFLFSVCRWVA